MKTCGDCAHWHRPYEPENLWDVVRYEWFKLWRPKYKDGTPITDWSTFTCPSGKYANNPNVMVHWNIFPACKKYFKPKVTPSTPESR
jgi:hypothetical protein